MNMPSAVLEDARLAAAVPGTVAQRAEEEDDGPALSSFKASYDGLNVITFTVVGKPGTKIRLAFYASTGVDVNGWNGGKPFEIGSNGSYSLIFKLDERIHSDSLPPIKAALNNGMGYAHVYVDGNTSMKQTCPIVLLPT